MQRTSSIELRIPALDSDRHSGIFTRVAPQAEAQWLHALELACALGVIALSGFACGYAMSALLANWHLT